MRFLGMASDSSGSDWNKLSQMIDEELEKLGMDLAEESVYLVYSESPEKILKGAALCFVARSVIGPKKELSAPLSQKDWIAAPVHCQEVQGETFEDVLEGVVKLSRKLSKGLQGFFLRVKRELKPELNIRVEVIFHE
jgi:hypothetical protein